MSNILKKIANFIDILFLPDVDIQARNRKNALRMQQYHRVSANEVDLTKETQND